MDSFERVIRVEIFQDILEESKMDWKGLSRENVPEVVRSPRE
ncbi:hypothetical protein [Laspinema olomoucense]|nr:hypothetical protein [Laspinema sp. D3d]